MCLKLDSLFHTNNFILCLLSRCSCRTTIKREKRKRGGMQSTRIARAVLTRTVRRGVAPMAMCCQRVAFPAAATTIASPMAMPLFTQMRRYADDHHEAPKEGDSKASPYLLDKNDVLQRVLEVVKNFEKVDGVEGHRRVPLRKRPWTGFAGRC